MGTGTDARHIALPWVVGAGVALAACAPSRREVFAPVAGGVSARTGYEVRWNAGDAAAAAEVDALLRDELTVDDAVRIALLSNDGLQADLDALGVARGELASARAVANPELGAEVKFPVDGGDPQIELAAVQDVLDLIALRYRCAAASFELEVARLRAVGTVVDLVAEVRAAYFTAQADEQRLEMRRMVLEATDISYTLAQRLHEAGNITDLDLLRERDLYEQARLAVATAEAARMQSREQLSAVLGLWGERTAWTLPGRLPALPETALDVAHLERIAVERSLDLEATRWQLRASGKRVGLARLDRWLPELGLGVAAEREGGDGGGWGVGPAAVLSVPLWNWNTGAIQRREAELSMAQKRYAHDAIAVRAGARAARARLRAARSTAAAYRDTVLPLRARIVAETQRAYNAMAASAFELFAARRLQIEAGAAHVDALLEYWLARAAVEQIVAGRRPGGAPARAAADAPRGGMAGGGDHE